MGLRVWVLGLNPGCVMMLGVAGGGRWWMQSAGTCVCFAAVSVAFKHKQQCQG